MICNWRSHFMESNNHLGPNFLDLQSYVQLRYKLNVDMTLFFRGSYCTSNILNDIIVTGNDNSGK